MKKPKSKPKKSKTSKLVGKKTLLSELMQKNPEAVGVLFSRGMGCIGCPAAMQETLEEGCLAHGINPDEIIAEINKRSKPKSKPKKKKKC